MRESQIKEERHNGKFHAENKPAYIRYSAHGTIEQERWYHHGELHRTHGPAYTRYKENGDIVEMYYENGNHLKTEVTETGSTIVRMIRYIQSRYPHSHLTALTPRRLELMIYMADWCYALNSDGDTITDETWVIENGIPVCPHPKNADHGNLTAGNRAVIDHVIEITYELSMADVVRTVWATKPILHGKEGQAINIRKSVEAYTKPYSPSV